MTRFAKSASKADAPPPKKSNDSERDKPIPADHLPPHYPNFDYDAPRETMPDGFYGS